MNHVVPGRLTILVMHPDPLLRAGIAAVLRQHADFETFVDGDPISHRPRIDVVITDHNTATRLAGSSHPTHSSLVAARFLVLTSNYREADIRCAFKVGIHGYIMLGGTLDELIEGATAVANGLRYVSRSVAQRMADSLTHMSLTSREIAVLGLVAAGESNKAIARELQIELNTVKSHMTAIMAKLGATSRTQAASIAATRGLVEQRALTRGTPGRRRAGATKDRAQFA